jgi:hypothetical protein
VPVPVLRRRPTRKTRRPSDPSARFRLTFSVTELSELALRQMKVDPTKLVDYLLSRSHPVGQRKARYFRALGFGAETSDELETALIVHGSENPVVRREETRFGSKYVVDGPFRAANGERVELRSIWFIEAGSEVARFVTAYPTAEPKARRRDV